jgi:RNA polymerase sigma factor (sigma-70 family)
MEVSALRYSGGIGLHGRSPLLRLQSDERLISLTRRGNTAAFEVLVSRYHTRLLAFCRHLLGSREDAEDVLQEVLAAAFNAILADERAINVRPWLYRIARNRSLNHLRRIQAIGVDSMDIHLSENGTSTADKVHDREQFRLLVGDIHQLPETQRTALVLREMDALSYEQIAEAMDTTVPGVKSLLVRARISLAGAAEARLLSCEDVRIELAEVAEGLRKRPTSLVRRHLRSCRRCSSFQGQLKHTNKALAALLPIGPLALLRKLAIVHLSHSAGTGSGATAASATGATGAAAGPAAAVAGTAGGTAMFGSTGGLISAGAGAIATKAAAGLAAAAIVTAGAVEASHGVHRSAPPAAGAVQPIGAAPGHVASAPLTHAALTAIEHPARKRRHKPGTKTATQSKRALAATASASSAKTDPSAPKKKKTPAGRTQAQTDPTVLPSASPTPSATPTGTADTSGTGGSSTAPSSTSSGTTGPSGPSGTTSTSPSSDGSTTTTSSTGSTAPSDGTSSGSSAGTTTDPSAATGTTGASGPTAGTTDGSGTLSAPLF